MPDAYRDERTVLEEREEALRRTLEEVRSRSRALSQESVDLEAELAKVTTDLDNLRKKRQLPIARTLIASPCDVPWSSMRGDDRVRHCTECARDVHNLSAMTQPEVDAFLQEMAGAATLPCITLYQRADGTMLTADCPVGMRQRKKRAFLAAAIGTGAAAIVGLTGLAFLLHRHPVRHGPEAPPTSSVVEASAAPVDTAVGYVQVTGPDGARVFEDNRELGVVPLTIPTAPGAHALRIEKADGKQSRTITALVVARDVVHINVSFDARQGRTGGVPYRPHRPTTKGGVDPF